MVKSVLLSNWSQSGALVAGIKASKELNLNNPDVQKAFKTGALFGACAAISDNIIKEVWEDVRKKEEN